MELYQRNGQLQIHEMRDDEGNIQDISFFEHKVKNKGVGEGFLLLNTPVFFILIHSLICRVD